MIKRYPVFFFVILLMCAAGSLYAQQQAHYSQYMINNYIINPAVAGTSEGLEARMGYRRQWVGVEDAPRTIYISVHGALGRVNTSSFTKKKNLNYKWKYDNGFHGIGGYVYSDKTGPLSRSGVYLSYGYNLAITSKVRAALGVFAGVQQFTADASKLEFYDGTDPLAAGLSDMVPDLAVGSWIYSNKFYFGASLNQLFQNNLDFITSENDEYNKLVNHYFITSGYKVELSPEVSWIPSFLLKMAQSSPVSADINSKIKYKDHLWAGISYRHRDAVVLLLGFTVKQWIDFGYSWDIVTSDFNQYAKGSHEITMGFKFGKIQQRVYNPSDFW
jgi:type IX secretion system PorP/SprF family membrane protein